MSREVLLGLTLGLVVLFIDQFLTLKRLPAMSYFFYTILFLLAFISTYWSMRLPMWLRTWATSVFYIWGIYNALFGRSYGAHLTLEHLGLSILLFFILSVLFVIPIWRIWQGHFKFKVLFMYPIVSISLALIIAAVEEQVFIHKYSEGVSPTARWTVNTSWLAYEPELNGKGAVLRGGD